MVHFSGGADTNWYLVSVGISRTAPLVWQTQGAQPSGENRADAGEEAHHGGVVCQKVQAGRIGIEEDELRAQEEIGAQIPPNKGIDAVQGHREGEEFQEGKTVFCLPVSHGRVCPGVVPDVEGQENKAPVGEKQVCGPGDRHAAEAGEVEDVLGEQNPGDRLQHHDLDFPG